MDPMSTGGFGFDQYEQSVALNDYNVDISPGSIAQGDINATGDFVVDFVNSIPSFPQLETDAIYTLIGLAVVAVIFVVVLKEI